MDVKAFSNQLRNRMDEQIEAVRREESDELKATAKIVQVIRDHLFELKRFIHQYEFKDPEEEILFFKEVKPDFLGKYYYYDQLLSITIETSLMVFPNQKRYYRKTLKQIRKFQKNNIDFFQYWATGGDHLDYKYFIRNREVLNDPNLDGEFSTVYDIKLARLLAYEELKEYVDSILEIRKHKPKLKWTGSKTALIELIYGLQTVGAFNNSTADVKQIATSFEELFDITLGNFYDTFQEIRIRKKNTTKFIDQMKARLLERANSADGL